VPGEFPGKRRKHVNCLLIFARFGVEIIIQGDNQYAGGFRLRDHLPEPWPKPVPGDFGRGDKGVVAFPADLGKTEEDVEDPEEI